MDGCWQPWLLGCAIDWEAWGAIGTMLATAVALYLGLAAFTREEMRRKQLAGAHASSMRIRLVVLKENFAGLEKTSAALSDSDPSSAQLAAIAKEATVGANLISWQEAAELAAHDPSLGSKVFHAMEMAAILLQMTQWEIDNHAAPECSNFRKEFIRTLVKGAQKGVALAGEAVAAIEAPPKNRKPRFSMR